MKIIIIFGLAICSFGAASGVVSYTDATTCKEVTVVGTFPDAADSSAWVWIADCTAGTALATSTIKNVNAACAYYGIDAYYDVTAT